MDSLARNATKTGMKRRPKDTSASDQFLWSDLPGELDRRLTQGVQLRSSPEILAGWCESGFAILDSAAPEPGSGELFYYPGSQKTDDLLFANNTKALRPGDPDGPNYSETLEEIAAEQGLKREYLHIPKGSALMWAADLMHGGARISSPHTRRSLVTHYAPKSARIPYHPHPDWTLRQVRDRAWVVAQQ
jgi:hypothetical protein